MSCSSPAARRAGWPKAPASRRRKAPHIIDINMGCPSKQVTNGAAGSALMRDLDHALRLDRSDRRRRSRAGDAEDAARLGSRQHQRAGTCAPRRSRRRRRSITVHGRTRCQFYDGTRRLGGDPRRQGERVAFRSSSTATSARSTTPLARSPLSGADARDDRPRRARPALVSRAGRALSRDRRTRSHAAARRATRHDRRALRRDDRPSWRCDRPPPCAQASRPGRSTPRSDRRRAGRAAQGSPRPRAHRRRAGEARRQLADAYDAFAWRAAA